MAFDFEGGSFAPISKSLIRTDAGLRLADVRREGDDIWFILIEADVLLTDPTHGTPSPYLLIHREVRLKADYSAVMESVDSVTLSYERCGVDIIPRTFHVTDIPRVTDAQYDDDASVETYNVYPMDLFLTWNDQNLAKKIIWLSEDNCESWVITDNCVLVREGAELYSNLNGSLDDALASIIYDARLEGATMVSNDVMVHDTSLPLIYLSENREQLMAYAVDVLGRADAMGVPIFYDQDHVLKYSAEKARNPVCCAGTNIYATCPFQSVRFLQRVLPNVSTIAGDYSLRNDGILNSSSISILAVLTDGYLRDIDWSPLISFLSSQNVQTGNTLYGYFTAEVSPGSELMVSSLDQTDSSSGESQGDDDSPQVDPSAPNVYDPEFDEATITLWENRSKSFFTILAIIATFIILIKLFKRKENE